MEEGPTPTDPQLSGRSGGKQPNLILMIRSEFVRIKLPPSIVKKISLIGLARVQHRERVPAGAPTSVHFPHWCEG